MNKIVRQDLDEIIAENLSWKKLFNSTIVVKFRQVNKKFTKNFSHVTIRFGRMKNNFF